MRGRRLDPCRRALKVEKGSSAARACDIVRLEDPRPCGLEDVVSQPERLPGTQCGGGSRASVSLDEDRISDSLAEQRANIRGGGEQNSEKIARTIV